MLAFALALVLVAAAATTLAVLVLLLAKTAGLRLERELLALAPPADPAALPRVTAIVPARNEERAIGACLERLLALDPPPFEILVCDDGSTDATPAIVDAVARGKGAGRVRVVPIVSDQAERATYRSGKTYVLSRAVEHATGDWLLFLDADVRVRPDALWRALGFALRRGVPAMSCSGFYVNPGLLGDLLESLLLVATFLFQPVRAINDPSRRETSWLNGQFILIERGAYRSVGGHAAIRDFAMDDLSFGRLLKVRSVPALFLPGAQLFECRNYHGLSEARRGWVRLIAGASPWLRLGPTFFVAVPAGIALTTVVPWLTLIAWAAGFLPDGPALGGLSLGALAAGQVAFATVVFASFRAGMRHAVWPSVLLPLAGALALPVFAGAWRARFGSGTTDFRGRTIPIVDDPSRLLVVDGSARS